MNSSKTTSWINIENVSIRLFSLILFLVSIVITIIVFMIVSNSLRDSALELQKKSLSQVINVAADGVLIDLREDLIEIGTSLQNRIEIRQALQEFYKHGDTTNLIHQLDDPLINGFAGFGEIELVKLRLYNNEYQAIAESSRGLKNIHSNLPDFIFNKAKVRTGANSLKAIGGLWTNKKSNTVLYSLLLPVGGLRIQGYLEIIINPLFNLIDISKVTQKPLTIYNIDGVELTSHYPIKDLSNLTLEEIQYTLIGNDNTAAFKLVLLDDISQFNRDMEFTQLFAVTIFISLFITVILVTIFLMSRFLFKPIRHMIEQMRLVANGDLSIEVDHRGLKEFHELALNFNTMKEIVHGNMQKLEQMSLMDGLTGIGNRRLFDQTLNNEWRRHNRIENFLSLIICDIDFFKQFNDTYGHLKGDDCIQQIAHALKKSIYRPLDLVCRYGGEEFALILPDTSFNGALHIAELIQQLISELKIPHEKSLASNYVTLSLGVAIVPVEGISSPDDLFKAADNALYRAKENGRNKIEMARN